MWEEQARHCPLCAGALRPGQVAGRERLRCGACRFVLFRNPACAALGVVLDEDARVLLVRRAIAPFRGAWALPGGYQEVDETPEQAVVREVREEAGVTVEPQGLLDLVYGGDDPRKPANLAVFLCRPASGTARAGAEESDVGWFPLDAPPSPLGFDNYERILGRLVDRGRYPVSPWARVREILEKAEERP